MVRLSPNAIDFLAVSFLAASCGKEASADRPRGPQAFPVKAITAEAQTVPQSKRGL